MCAELMFLNIDDVTAFPRYPQTMPGYYGCQTMAHVNSWRKRFNAPLLPWVFVHLQPYGQCLCSA